MGQKDQKLRFAEVQQGLDVGVALLRHWMKRALVTLELGYGDGAWTTFTYGDLCKLTFVREMVTFGYPVNVADKIAHRILQDEDLWQPDLPPQAYWRAFAGHVIAVGHRDAKWSLYKFKKSGKIPFSGSNLFIDAEPVIQDVFDRTFAAIEQRQRA